MHMGTFIARIGRLAPSLLALSFALADELPAQERSARASNVLINGALGAGVVAARQLIAGEPLRPRRLLLGAAGGAVISAGKQVTAQGFDGSGLLGRQVGAIGIAVVGHAAGDSLAFVLPIGPLQLGIHPSSADVVRTRFDLFDAVVPLVTAVVNEAQLDPRASISTGTPVFRQKGRRMPLGHNAAGLAMGGTIYVSEELTARERRHVLAHEGVHVIQWDSFRQLVAYPVERHILARLHGSEALTRRLDIGVLAPGAVLAMVPFIAYERQPWEREANALVKYQPPVRFRASVTAP